TATWRGSTASCGTRRRRDTGGGVGGRRYGSWCCCWIGTGVGSERSGVAGRTSLNRSTGIGHPRRQRPESELRERTEAVGISEKCQKSGYEGASVTCPHCGRAAAVHSHRSHNSFSPLAAI